MWRAECFCNLNSLPDSCQKKKNPPRETTEGFKESREAAINVIPTLGFSVNEMGDHIPILKLIPITLSCVSPPLNFFPKERKAPSVSKVKHKYWDLQWLAHDTASVYEHVTPSSREIHVHTPDLLLTTCRRTRVQYMWQRWDALTTRQLRKTGQGSAAQSYVLKRKMLQNPSRHVRS